MADNFQIPRGIPIQPPKPTSTQKTPKNSNKQVFQKMFLEELEKSALKFSAHAEKRLALNNISLSTQQINQLEDAVDRLALKGGKESLIMLDDLAFVVSVANKTVITAINKERVKENVFTNIDSAVIT